MRKAVDHPLTYKDAGVMGFVVRLVTAAANVDGRRGGLVVQRHGHLNDEINSVENAWRTNNQNIDHLPPVNVRERPAGHIHLNTLQVD